MPQTDARLLEVEALDVWYGRVHAVRSVSFHVDRGEIVGMIGPNGAGKSTTLRAIMGIVPARGGEIRVGGASVRGLAPERVARARVALVPEGRRIYPHFTVEENLRLGRLARGRRGQDGDGWVAELFPMLAQFRHRQAGALSGGQQQQLALARALAADPDVLLLDEPSLGLAPKIVDAVFEALLKVRERGVAILLVEQRAMRTVAFADRTHVLTNGELRMTLSRTDAEDTDRLVAAYFS